MIIWVEDMAKAIANKYEIKGDALHCGGFCCIYGGLDLNGDKDGYQKMTILRAAIIGS